MSEKIYTFPKRDFTISFKQEGTGKTAKVTVEQKEFKTPIIFRLNEGQEGTRLTATTDSPAIFAIENYYKNIQGEKLTTGIDEPEYFCVEHPTEDIHVEIAPLGTNSTNMIYAVAPEENPSTQPRHFTIKFRPLLEPKSDYEISVTITQEGKPDEGKFSVTPSALSVDAAGAKKTISVTSTSNGKNAPWSISTPDSEFPDWLPKPKAGSKPGDLVIDVLSNDGVHYF